MNRHVSLDELARLGAGDLKPGKATRLRHHLATCSRCIQLNSQLSGVPAVLSSLEFGPIPENLPARIEMALVVEAQLRLASEPATEAGRRDLPAATPVGLSRGWRLPRPPVAATRALATAGAIALIGGGYQIASHASPPASTASSSSSAAAAAPSAAASQGVRARVNYGYGALGSSGSARPRHCARRRARMSTRTGSQVRPACTSRATSVRRSRARPAGPTTNRPRKRSSPEP